MSSATASVGARRLPLFLPPIAIAVFVVVIGAVLAAAGDTFGYDFGAYHDAARRLLAGEALYQTDVRFMGAEGLFFYPPPFAVALVPFGLLPLNVAAVLWLGVLLVAFFAAVALMPVRPGVRWLTLLLAGMSWPVAYTFKLGQVTPLLLLAFVIGWRWMADPIRLGASSAAGALIKLQPGILLAWAALVGRWRAVGAGVAVGFAVSAVATLVVGVGAWLDYGTLLRQVSDPIITPHNFTPGAVAYQATGSQPLGSTVQLVTSALVLGVVLVAARWATLEASFLVAVVASQLLSPTLWDHYAMVLLLPVAWLMDRGRALAALVPLATSIVIVGLTPGAAYPAAFAITLAWVTVEGLRTRRQPALATV